MADFDLEALSLSELKKMQKDVAKAISTTEVRQKAEARAKVEAFAKELGYSLAKLMGGDAKPKRAPVAPKYRHPENPALTWSGRGAQTAVVHQGSGGGQNRRGHGHRLSVAADIPIAMFQQKRSLRRGAATERRRSQWATGLAQDRCGGRKAAKWRCGVASKASYEGGGWLRAGRPLSVARIPL